MAERRVQERQADLRRSEMARESGRTSGSIALARSQAVGPPKMMTRSQMAAQMARTKGIMVLPDGRRIRRPEDLPPEDELARGDPAAMATAKANLQFQLVDLQRRLASVEQARLIPGASPRSEIDWENNPPEHVKQAFEEQGAENERLRREFERLVAENKRLEDKAEKARLAAEQASREAQQSRQNSQEAVQQPTAAPLAQETGKKGGGGR
jgi:hypothetical protein